MSEVHGAFSIRYLPSTSGGQPNVIAISCSVLGDFWQSDYNLKESFLYLILKFLLDDIFLLGNIVSPHRKVSFKLYAYIYSPTYVYLDILRRIFNSMSLWLFETYLLSVYPPASIFCICILNSIPIKIPISFFIEIEKHLKILMELQRPHIAKTVWTRKINSARGITISRSQDIL